MAAAQPAVGTKSGLQAFRAFLSVAFSDPENAAENSDFPPPPHSAQPE
jgi:hypothetical protein